MLAIAASVDASSRIGTVTDAAGAPAAARVSVARRAATSTGTLVAERSTHASRAACAARMRSMSS